MKFLPLGVLACVLLSGCQPKIELSAQAEFMLNLTNLCGETFLGKVVSTDPQDEDWRGKVLTVGPVDCTEERIKMPLAVGDDKSRVWTITPREDAISLSHAHTLKDGSPDPVTAYGGTTKTEGTSTRQDFPVDQYSIDLFKANELGASVTNTWTLEHEPGKYFVYQLTRKGRNFRAEFSVNSAE